jgi:hypothetical protein
MTTAPDQPPQPQAPGGWNLPFEESEPFPLPDIADAIISDNVTVMAAFTPTPFGAFPTLIFRFSRSDGGPALPPVVFITDAARTHHLVHLVGAAAAAAIRKAAVA